MIAVGFVLLALGVVLFFVADEFDWERLCVAGSLTAFFGFAFMVAGIAIWLWHNAP